MGLNLYFIPQFGAIASAWTTLASFSFANLAYVWYTVVRVKISLPLRQFVLLLILGIFLWGAFYSLDQISGSWLLTTCLSGILFVFGAFGSGLISLQQIRSFKI